VLFFAIGGAIAWFVVPTGEGGAPKDAPPVTATLDGKPLALDGDALATLDAARAIGREYLARPLTLAVPGGGQEARTREELGARIDARRLAALIAQVRNPKSALRRAHAQVGGGKPLVLPLPVVADAKLALDALLQLKDDVDRAPVDARLDLEHRKVQPDEPGRRLDVYATLARLDEAFTIGQERVDAVVETLPAQRTADQLQGVRIDDVLGWFETKYARDQKHEARTFNLRNAASKLNGYVIFPGETFDFNTVVGPRNEANGYKVAPVIAQGELVDGIGGGTCQIAGTLHGAAFFAGLDIVERKPHTRPSFYIKMGLDAAVAYPTITLRLKNPFSFPVVLHETVQGGVVRAEILGPQRTRDVTFIRKIADVTPFQEKEIPDPKLPKGARQLKQRGIPGFRIARWRIVRDGPFAVRERYLDSYPSTTQIWQVGTGDPDPKFEARDDEHPEYVADEVLTISQGPNIKSPKSDASVRGGPMVESRVAGRYGSYGWTVREGFAKEVAGTNGNKNRCKKGDDACESARTGVD
jgi:vancomycin resistance protein YoaR